MSSLDEILEKWNMDNVPDLKIELENLIEDAYKRGYTTGVIDNSINKDKLVREARLNERKRAWHEVQDLEGMYNESVSADHFAEIHAVLRDVYRYQEDRIKVLKADTAVTDLASNDPDTTTELLKSAPKSTNDKEEKK